ncbi:MAG: hypothetical protein A2X55_11625 [Nitrospirae bacterium GWB2_47_37]|nr:hypothetical protein [Nitrospirota bacterium]OGW21732.1 MAG: hypothetical protein A2Z82_00030 [Nitrospirae bacterium GWA2_46_11]OGW25129.1 MAG: hypothetical protein A2X55_11625 [Nitrospirae bacterium GWB2_47_37]HAK88870.1 hypothetical protein [Nitrospiraceae bacterium]
MEALEIKSTKDRMIISIDKSSIDSDYIIELMDRLKTETLAKKVDFSKGILKLADEIKKKWWKENKDEFLGVAVR